jgi:Uma2 family endonuclease
MTRSLQQPIAPAKVTLDQYHLMVDAGVWDDRHVELLNGVVVEMPSEGASHASDASRTCEYLTLFTTQRVSLSIG